MIIYCNFLKKIFLKVFIMFTVSVVMNIKQTFKEEDSSEILKNIGSMTDIEE